MFKLIHQLHLQIKPSLTQKDTRLLLNGSLVLGQALHARHSLPNQHSFFVHLPLHLNREHYIPAQVAVVKYCIEIKESLFYLYTSRLSIISLSCLSRLQHPFQADHPMYSMIYPMLCRDGCEPAALPLVLLQK